MQSATRMGITIKFSDDNAIVKLSGGVLTLADGTKINIALRSIVKFGSDRHVSIED